jgi:hypothetical protein
VRIYEARHNGTAIVIGGGPSLLSDLTNARAIRPGATLLGANFAASVVPEIEHVWTQHIEIAGKIKSQAPVKVHSRPRKFQTRVNGPIWQTGVSKEQEAAVDYLWPDLGWVAGSSGFSAALWAKHGLGFDEVILVGIPLTQDVRIYSAGYDAATRAGSRPPQHDFDKHYASPDSLEHWQQCIRNFTEQGKTAGIYSMSGFTREWLGAPTDMMAKAA